MEEHERKEYLVYRVTYLLESKERGKNNLYLGKDEWEIHACVLSGEINSHLPSMIAIG